MAKLTEQEQYWVWLFSIDGIGPRRFYAILEWFEDAKNVWDAAYADNDALKKFGEKTREAIISSRRDEYMENILRRIERADCRVVTRLSPQYPPLLAEIADPPPALFVRGGELMLERAVAIVGTRYCTRIAQDVAIRLGRDLSQAGVTVVSGMARGVDSFAHQGALQGEAPTVAVLGCGVDVVYPPENRELYDKIMGQGTIVSEYLPGTQPYPGNFPARNRIVSGMSRAVVVVEAPKKSGTMITVSLAQEQGRDVFAVPGSILSGKCEGTNELLKQGAFVLTEAQDVLREYGWERRTRQEEKPVAAKAADGDDIFSQIVMAALQRGTFSYDELCAIAGLAAKEMGALLTKMEMEGKILRLPGKRYTAVS